MSEIGFILDDMKWSYSRIRLFFECPYAYYLQYVLCKPASENAFGEYGNFIHKILEKYYKGELTLFELVDYYTENYGEAVRHAFPPNSYVDLNTKYFEEGLKYFDSFEGFDEEILGVEVQYDFKLGKYDFTGIIDVESKSGDLYIINDHKSKSRLHKTRLTSKDNPQDWIRLVDGRFIPRDLVRQLYIYSIPFNERYGRYPDLLRFNMFRINDWYTVEFNMDDFEEAKEWATKTIEDIYNTTEFICSKPSNDFFCNYICSMGTYCKNSNRYLGIE